MWKLTVIQKRKCDHMEGTYDEKVWFVSSDMNEITMLIMRLSQIGNGVETTFTIERMGKEDSNAV